LQKIPEKIVYTVSNEVRSAGVNKPMGVEV